MQALFTDKQYDAVARLYATLLGRFPNLRLAYPIEETHAETRAGGGLEGVRTSAERRDARATAAARDDLPNVDTDKLTDARRRVFAGALGHFHVQRNKFDPGRRSTGNASSSRREPRWRRGTRDASDGSSNGDRT